MKQRKRAMIAYIDRGDRCGCAMGARFLGAMLIACTVWYGWHWQESILSPGSTAGHIVGVLFTAAILGKLVGILLYKYRDWIRHNHS